LRRLSYGKGWREVRRQLWHRNPFRVICSTNITADPRLASPLHEGVSRDGSHFFPVFSYDRFTRLSDHGVRALSAYFLTRTPFTRRRGRSGIPFPFNSGYLQAGHDGG
jgi:nicotinate dehydrogenase subunit B